MKFKILHFKVLWIAVSVLLIAGCASQQKKADGAAAQVAADAWLNSLDTGNTENLWDQTAEMAKARYSKDTRVKFWFGTREVMGSLIRRKEPVNWVMEPWQAKLPEGTYRHLQYDSDFEKQKDVLEELILVKENGEWKVVNWYLGSWGAWRW